jgi:hypothetical protein
MYALPNLSASLSREIFADLCASLPPPPNDTPEDRASRDAAAMDAVAALHPTDAIEARLAMHVVVAEVFVMDCHRLASQYRNDITATMRCRAQANASLREMRGLLRDLRRMQADREKAEREMHPAAMERAGYWWRDCSVPEPEPEPAPSEPQEFAKLTEAEQYAVLYPDRAARIRAAGGLPAKLDFGPPEPDLVSAIVNSTSPTLRALDHPTPTVSLTENVRR